MYLNPVLEQCKGSNLRTHSVHGLSANDANKSAYWCQLVWFASYEVDFSYQKAVFHISDFTSISDFDHYHTTTDLV